MKVAWLIGLMLIAPPARAQQIDCDGLWDMALVARALAEEKLPRDTIVRSLLRIYETPLPFTELMAGVAISDNQSAREFAAGLRAACVRKTVPLSGI